MLCPTVSMYYGIVLVRAECVRCPWLLAETKVANILGIFLLVRAECVRCPWLLAETKVATILAIFLFGPSRVRALPLAAGINKGGHYLRYFSSCCCSCSCFNTVVQNPRRGCRIGFKFLQGLLSNKKIMIPMKKKISGTAL